MISSIVPAKAESVMECSLCETVNDLDAEINVRLEPEERKN